MNKKTKYNQSYVSVVTPVYNRGNLLKKAIQSVLDQTHSHVEHIIVDDASSEDIKSIVDSFEDPRLRYIRHEENKMIATAYNTGIQNARGDYIAILESDDWWVPTKLEKQLSLLQEDPEAKVAYCKAVGVNEKGEELYEKPCYGEGNVLKMCLKRNITARPSVLLMQKELFDKIGLYDKKTDPYSTTDMVIRLANETNFVCVKEPLVYCLEHENNYSDEVAEKKDMKLRVHTQIVEKNKAIFKKHPFLFSQKLRTVGLTHLSLGNKKEARGYFLRAFKVFPPSLMAIRDLLRTI